MSDLLTTRRLRPRFPQRISERRKARVLGTSVPRVRTSSRDSQESLNASMKLLREQDEHESVLVKQQLHIVKEHVRRKSVFARIEDAIAAIRAGRMVIVVDDEDRENEGDLTIAAEKITPEAINFMAQYGRGLICLALDPAICKRLDLQPMSAVNT